MGEAGDLNAYMTLRQAAKLRSVALATIYNAINRGDLKTAEVFGKTVLLRSSFLEWEPVETGLRASGKGSKMQQQADNQETCSEREHGWLGVPTKTVFMSRRGSPFPRPDTPTLMTDRVLYTPGEGEESSHDVAVTDRALADALDRYASDPEQQALERQSLLSDIGFDTRRQYRVLEDFARNVYYFRYVD